jgi:hypothetical protein
VEYNSKNPVILLNLMPSCRSVNNDHIQEWMNQDEEELLLTENTADLVSLAGDYHLDEDNKAAQKDHKMSDSGGMKGIRMQHLKLNNKVK